MRGADSLSHFNEDEFLTGGPCPSCRLAIDKDTGRLKWCTARNDAWRFRVKLMLLIPAVLLPITIIIIAMSRSQGINKPPYQRAFAAHDGRGQNQGTEEKDTPNSYSIADGSGQPEIGYAPVESAKSARAFKRRKREIDQVSLSDQTPDDCNGSIDSLKEESDFTDWSNEDERTEYEGGPEEYKSEEEWAKVRRSGPIDEKLQSTSDIRLFWKEKLDHRRIREIQANIMLQHMDRTANPCDDFYQYACGNWAKTNPIPKDKAGYDTFEIIRESVSVVLRELLEEPIPPDVNGQDAIVKAKNLYRSCMNHDILERRMQQPLQDILNTLGGWPMLETNWDPEKFDWLLLVARLKKYNNEILIRESVAVDFQNTDQYVIQFGQANLGLPTRDFFLHPWGRFYLVAYKNYLIAVARILGVSLRRATDDAEEIVNFETKLANITLSPHQGRNISDVYQNMTLGNLKSLIPQINWQRYLAIVLTKPIDFSEPVVVYEVRYLQDLVNLLSQTPPRTIANYLLWRFVQHRVNNLDGRFQEAKLLLHNVLFGRQAVPARWESCVQQVNSNMGMAVGSMFVRKYFDEESREDTLKMTRSIQEAFKDLLVNTSWITNNTQELATEKIDAMLLTIGYPDFILEPDLLNDHYKDVTIHPDTYFENTLNILQHMARSENARLGTRVDKDALWLSAPATVNAYYGLSKNRMMIPAGILQPPFYHRHFPRALNYAGVGAVIGHEITHGFDDQGRHFDKDGNFHNWWTLRERFIFYMLSLCLKNQYSQYLVKEIGMHVNGSNTKGENIADNDGVNQAYRAYKKWLRHHLESDETLPGMNATGEQLFFLNYAQLWCGSMRPPAMISKLMTGVHSPGRYRVIGPLSNSEDFSKVYKCPLGAPMNPVKKCSVW